MIMKHILVIDDDDSLRKVIVKALSKQGYRITEASSGAEGIRLARSELPELVVSDVNMPGTDGFAVLKALRGGPATSAIPIILMTGNSDPDGLRQGMDGGADDYLAKPFVMRELFATVGARLERKEAMQAQARAEEVRLLRTILDILHQRVFWKDRNGRYAGANNRFLEDCGATNVIGKTDQDLPWTPEKTESFQADDQSVIETGRPTLDVVGKLTSATGKTLWLSTCKVPMLDSNGAITGVLGTYLDVTSLKEAEQERQLLEVQLRQGQKIEAIGQLAAGIAHEINTPIQYLGDNIQFLQESFEDLCKVLENREQLIQAAKGNCMTADTLARAEKISKASDLEYLLKQIPVAINQSIEGIARITKIVRAMKEFSHPGGQEKCASDLNHAIETTLTVARNEWKYVAEVKTDFDPELPPVPCYIGEFNQAILNLIVNAAHAIGDVVANHPETKGIIALRTRRVGENVEIRVTDTGAGIPESIRPRIFEPFFTTKQVGKGTGQGLAVVYSSIVKKHGGAVHFESVVNKGTTFVLTLPISPPPANLKTARERVD
jgi:PAS domain S-box-containing protein